MDSSTFSNMALPAHRTDDSVTFHAQTVPFSTLSAIDIHRLYLELPEGSDLPFDYLDHPFSSSSNFVQDDSSTSQSASDVLNWLLNTPQPPDGISDPRITSTDRPDSAAIHKPVFPTPSPERYKEMLQQEAPTVPSQPCVNSAGAFDVISTSDRFYIDIWSPSSDGGPVQISQQPQSFYASISPGMSATDISGISLPFSRPPSAPAPSYSATQPLSLDDSSLGTGETDRISPESANIMASSSATRATFSGQSQTCNRISSSSGAMIPQRRYKSRGSKYGSISYAAPIIFDMENGSGLRIRDGLNRKYTGLKRRDDRVFLNQKSSISIRIEWPGYPSWTRQIRARDWRNPPRQITLAKLGTEVAKSIELFIRKMATVPGEKLWQVGAVGSNYINIDNIVLLALEPVSRSSWQPVFCLRD